MEYAEDKFSRQKDAETLPLRMFSPTHRKRRKQRRSSTHSISPPHNRRPSLVVHEEADYSVKVESWQRKINQEEGTDHEVNLNKARKFSQQEPGAGAGASVTMRRKTSERKPQAPRPLSSFGVIPERERERERDDDDGVPRSAAFY